MDKEKIKGQANIDIFNLRMAQKQGVITEFGKGKLEALEGIVDFIDSLQEESVSEELEDFAKRQAEGYYWGCKAGAKWKAENLWKPAEGDDLPEIDREVIAILDNGKVVFAHRPSEYWDGKNIDTGKVTRYYPKTYDKGGWNIPNIVYWLDVELQKEIGL